MGKRSVKSKGNKTVKCKEMDAILFKNGMVNTVQCHKRQGFDFPYYKLQHRETWSNIYEKVCPNCTEKIAEEEKLIVIVDCMAIDKNFNANDEAIENGIVNYVDWDDKKKEWISVFEMKIPCSICGNIQISKTNDLKGQVRQGVLF